jgi:hypothetical protein
MAGFWENAEPRAASGDIQVRALIEIVPIPTPLVVLVLASAWSPLIAAQCTGETKVLASDGAAGDTYGFSLAMSGDTAVVGAPQDDDLGFTSGSAYVLERDLGGGNAWGERKKLLASDGSASDRFGYSVAISADTIVVGAFNRRAAYVFERDFGGPDNWGETARLAASGTGASSGFGHSVAIDGDTIVVGAPTEDGVVAKTGAAYLFERDSGGPGNWGEVKMLISPEGVLFDRFGQSVSISGDTVLIGAPEDELGVRGVIAGLAPGAGPGSVFGSDHTYDELTVIDTATGGGTTLGGVGFAAVRGLAYDPGVGRYLGSDVVTDQLVSIDPSTGVGTAIGPMGFATVEGLAYDPLTGTLYGADTFLDQLIVIDTATGAGTPVGALGFPGVRGLAFDPASNELYGSEPATRTLLRIDPATGAGTFVATLTEPDVQGLAFDASGALFGVDNGAGLLAIDKVSGATTEFLVPDSGVLFVFERDAGGAGNWGETRELAGAAPFEQARLGTSVSICGDTLVAGAVGDFGLALLSGTALVFERDLGGAGAWGEVREIMASDGLLQAEFGAAVALLDDTILVGAPNDDPTGINGAGSAYVYERDLGGRDAWGEAAKLVASDANFFDRLGSSVALAPDSMAAGAPGDDAGAAYLFREAAATTYCTAGTSASGCRAQIAASGTPSASAASGFQLTATGVEGGKDGLFFFGDNGRQSSAWGNGTSFQCVVPPVRRAGLLPGVGTPGACDGSFSQDLNALWCPTCPKPWHNPGAGAVVQAQLWYRDPGNTSNRTTSLSDAIELLVCP